MMFETGLNIYFAHFYTIIHRFSNTLITMLTVTWPPASVTLGRHTDR
jgi:hypothetical protein